MTTNAQLEQRLAQSESRNRRLEKKAATANLEAEALRAEVRRMRHANYILQKNYENSESGAYRVRYEKLAETIQIIREMSNSGVTGIPEHTPKTLEPWLGPHWARRPVSALPVPTKDKN